MKNTFFKGHGLGNDYIALDPAALSFKLTPGIFAPSVTATGESAAMGFWLSSLQKNQILACAFLIPMAVKPRNPGTDYASLAATSITPNALEKNTLPWKLKAE